MTNINLRNLTNHFQDVRLVSLSSWQEASAISPRDRGGPYIVLQEGYDPEDLKMIPTEFVIGRSGKWLALGLFYKLPVPERRAEFVFGTAAEVMQMMSNLPSRAVLLERAGSDTPSASPESDEMAQAIQLGKQQGQSRQNAPDSKP